MRDQERDELIMELVLAALERAQDTRESYLRSACGYDSDLHAAVKERVLGGA